MHLRLLLVTFIIAGGCLQCTSAQSVFNTSGIDFFHGKTLDDYVHYHLTEANNILLHPAYNHSKKTLFYIYGFQEFREYKTVRRMISAYQQRGDHNILLLDWAKIGSGDYIFDAIPNVFRFGEMLADVFVQMTLNGLMLSNVHVVSHSLGSQLAGALGRNIIKKTNGQMKLKRITGLDPAFPLFYPAIFGGHLNGNDAEMVDVIHTDGWIYGAPVSTGTVDFWPNGGKVLSQPGCNPRNFRLLSNEDLCAHWRSVRFYVESVLRKGEPVFQSRQCGSWPLFKMGLCDGEGGLISMGIDCPAHARGDFYLQTNEVSPFSRGVEGTLFQGDRKRIANNADGIGVGQ